MQRVAQPTGPTLKHNTPGGNLEEVSAVLIEGEQSDVPTGDVPQVRQSDVGGLWPACFAGDGCFLMTGQELATAVQYQLNVIFIVVNNNMYGTIRMHQEREFPGHVHGTALVNPDFSAYAKSFGAHGEIVERTEQFAAAFERARNAGKPALIEIRIDLSLGAAGGNGLRGDSLHPKTGEKNDKRKWKMISTCRR